MSPPALRARQERDNRCSRPPDGYLLRTSRNVRRPRQQPSGYTRAVACSRRYEIKTHKRTDSASTFHLARSPSVHGQSIAVWLVQAGAALAWRPTAAGTIPLRYSSTLQYLCSALAAAAHGGRRPIMASSGPGDGDGPDGGDARRAAAVAVGGGLSTGPPAALPLQWPTAEPATPEGALTVAPSPTGVRRSQSLAPSPPGRASTFLGLQQRGYGFGQRSVGLARGCAE
ncbi:uncharacterized protein V1510DRAFT_408388 [Dipodascopsis tothii]|uniref:uncharacterized protein n=1 Tax=Dipodascopsis tothii TaxID=44089 RepID=UPI0034CF3707